jgi:hypothetical protein
MVKARPGVVKNPELEQTFNRIDQAQLDLRSLLGQRKIIQATDLMEKVVEDAKEFYRLIYSRP